MYVCTKIIKEDRKKIVDRLIRVVRIVFLFNVYHIKLSILENGWSVWLGVHPRCAGVMPLLRYTVHERGLYFKSKCSSYTWMR